MVDHTLENIDNLLKEIKNGGGVSQRLVSSVESLLGSNIITKDMDIKNFTQHTSRINEGVVINALEDYKSSFIKNDVVSFYSSENSNNFAKKLAQLISRFKTDMIVDGWSDSIDLTLEECKQLIIGYDEYFSIDNIGVDDYFNFDNIIAKKTKDVSYVKYIRAFLQALEDRQIDEIYLDRVMNILRDRKIDFDPKSVKERIDVKFSLMRAQATRINRDDIYGVIDSDYCNEEMGDLLSIRGKDVTSVEDILSRIGNCGKSEIIKVLDKIYDQCFNADSKHSVDIMIENYGCKIRSNILREFSPDEPLSLYLRLFLNLLIIPNEMDGVKYEVL